MIASAETAKRSSIQIVFIILLCGIALLLPFHKTLSTWPMMMAALIGIFLGNPLKKWHRLMASKRIWVFASMYLLFVVSWWWSQNSGEAAKDLKLKMAIGLMPILVAAFIELNKKDVRKIVACFVFSCFLFAIFSLVRATYLFIDTGMSHFYYKDLVSFTLIHPAYIGLFIAFAIIIVGIELLQSYRNMRQRTRLLAFVLIVFFLLFEFLLTAKIAIISIFLFLNIALYIGVKQQYNIKKAIAMVMLMNCIGISAIMALPYTRERFKLLFTYKEATYTNSVDSRSEIWHSAWQLVREHNGMGIGSGDTEDTLVSYYEKNGFKAGVEARYNTHNQYLQILVETGVAGLLFFLFILGAGIWWAVRDRNYLYLAFLLLFMINIFTESMLKTQSGVVFYAFFNTVLGLSGSRKISRDL